MARPYTCVDVAKLPGFPGCCGHCHEDADEGYDAAAGMSGDGENWSVCCKVAAFLKEIGEDSLEAPSAAMVKRIEDERSKR